MTARRPITLHIERLVVDGLPLTPAQAARMQAALERELARLLVHGGDPSTWGSAGAVHVAAAPAVTWDASRPHQLGRALARNVFASLNGAPRRASAVTAGPGASHDPTSRGPSPGGRS